MVVKNTYFKTILRTIRKSFGRFMAIFGIVALGIGILSGLLVTTPDMHKSMEEYYDEYNTADILIKGTMGLTDDDLKELSSNDDIKEIMPIYSMDILMEKDKNETITSRVFGLPFLNKNKEISINKLELIEGRAPERANECLVERQGELLQDIPIGSRLTISRENEDYNDLEDMYKEEEYEVVGVVGNSYYFSFEKESTNIGNGKLDTIVYIDEDNYDLNTYTDFLIRAKGFEDVSAFSDEYKDGVEVIAEDLKEIGKDRSKIRYDEVLVEADEEIHKAKEDYKGEKKEAGRELEKAYDEIQEGKTELKKSWQEIQDGKKELEGAKAELSKGREQIKQGEKELAKAKEDLEAGDKEYKEALNRLESEEKEFEKGVKPYTDILNRNGYSFSSAEQLFNTMEKDQSVRQAFDSVVKGAYDKVNSEIKEIDRQIEIIEETGKGKENLSKLEAEKRKLQEQQNKMPKDSSQFISGWRGIQEGKNQLEVSKKKIDQGWKEYKFNLQKLEDEKAKLEKDIWTGEKEIQASEEELNEGIEEYNKGAKELEDAEARYNDGEQRLKGELADAEQKIADAEEGMDDMEEPEWYVLDRSQNINHVSFATNVNKVDAISKVFPVFFYLVAALVALTTMTRMVEEERTQIGTLRALGYGKRTIMFKYFFYSGLATILGSIFGLIFGFLVLPAMIWNAFSPMYHLPKFMPQFNIRIASMSSGLAMIGTIVATYYAANNRLKEKPATLMLPRAPKSGKRIFLERIKFIWSRLSFNHKATARNLFRYKKHFLMTIIGVAGCAALLVVGFGLRDSIGDVANIQFEEIYDYELLVDLNSKYDLDGATRGILDNEDKIDKYMDLYVDNGYGLSNGLEFEIDIYAAEDLKQLGEFINLRKRQKNEAIDIDNESVVITEKAAEELELKIGSEVTIENSNGEKKDFTITGITEQYLNNRIYMSKDKYNEHFKEVDGSNTILAKTGRLEDTEQDRIIGDLLSEDEISRAEFIGDRRNTLDNLLTSINYIVIVIIIASGALAFIVLYNLTNINIEERNRELASLKVLGYHDEEVSSYIFRETRILTLIGMLLGLVLGYFLHRFIVEVMEDPQYMFGRDVKILSYVLSAVLTIIFSWIVNKFMSRKLKNIKMVDSMKAAD